MTKLSSATQKPLEEDGNILKQKYYHGFVSVDDLGELLKLPGDFLVRSPSKNPPPNQRDFLISMFIDPKDKGMKPGIYHFRLTFEDGFYFVDKVDNKKFPTIVELVNFYLESKENLKKTTDGSVLLNPVPRQSWEILNEDFTIHSKVVDGHFTTIFDGFWNSGTLKDSKVAVRQIVTNLCDKTSISELKKEARLNRCLDHINIVKCFGITVFNDPPLIITEFAAHGSLKEHLKQHNTPVPDCTIMCFGAACALEYLHATKLVHCDVGARSFLYGNKGVKLFDFSMARDGPTVEVDTQKPQALSWISPEAFHEMKFTYKSDVWSYGVLCWEIFSEGREPYKPLCYRDVMLLLLDGGRLEFAPGVPDNVTQIIILNIFDINPTTRYSMEQVVAYWENFNSITRPPYTVKYRPAMKGPPKRAFKNSVFKKESFMMKKGAQSSQMKDASFTADPLSVMGPPSEDLIGGKAGQKKKANPHKEIVNQQSRDQYENLNQFFAANGGKLSNQSAIKLKIMREHVDKEEKPKATTPRPNRVSTPSPHGKGKTKSPPVFNKPKKPIPQPEKTKKPSLYLRIGDLENKLNDEEPKNAKTRK